MSKLQTAAKAAKADGYEYMTSVVKSVFRTEYHHVVSIDEVIEQGKWPAAPRARFGKWYGRLGTSEVPAKSINKSVAIGRYCK